MLAELRTKLHFFPLLQAGSQIGTTTPCEVAVGPSANIREAAVQSSIPVPTVQTVFICSYCNIGNNELLHSIYADSFHFTSLGTGLMSERM
jgi:hypothetical protein